MRMLLDDGAMNPERQRRKRGGERSNVSFMEWGRTQMAWRGAKLTPLQGQHTGKHQWHQSSRDMESEGVTGANRKSQQLWSHTVICMVREKVHLNLLLYITTHKTSLIYNFFFFFCLWICSTIQCCDHRKAYMTQELNPESFHPIGKIIIPICS